MIKIIFFEDSPYASENRLFRMLLRDALKDIKCNFQLQEEKTVMGFEGSIRNDAYNFVILDIIATSPKPLFWRKINKVVPESLTGVELLRRCRLSEYGKHYIDTPVYIRTARSESHVRRLCEREKASGFYKAGLDDDKLIEEIKNECKNIIEKEKTPNGKQIFKKRNS
jgi:DNA-binding NarL/FixJ family response regulator